MRIVSPALVVSEMRYIHIYISVVVVVVAAERTTLFACQAAHQIVPQVKSFPFRLSIVVNVCLGSAGCVRQRDRVPRLWCLRGKQTWICNNILL